MEYSEKQLQIIDVAERLFAKQGFTGCSVRDIAKDADINVAMISYYFGSKDKLLEAVFRKRTSEITLQLESLSADTSLSPMEKMYKIVDTYIAKIMKNQDFHKVMVREQITPLVNNIIKETKQRNQGIVAQIIKQGQENGDFKKDIDIQFLMLTMMGTTNQLFTTKHYYREMNKMEDMPDEEFEQHLKRKLTHHLKTLFKALLSAK